MLSGDCHNAEMLHRDAAVRAALCAVAIPLAFFIAQVPLGGG